ncbi:MAG: hypothetical protein JRI58_12685 [Deltaproteobacteria bacterium]|nr:hypothetical protein [Deltaproteobacteria bacterium]
MIKRVCQEKKLTGRDGNLLLEKGDLYLFLCNLIDYNKVINRLERRGLNGELIALLIENDLKDKDFLQDKERMTRLAQSLSSQGYQVGDLVRDEEHNVYELLIGAGRNKAIRLRIGSSH